MNADEAPTPRHTHLHGTNHGEEMANDNYSRCSYDASNNDRGHVARISNSGTPWIYDQKLKNHRQNCRFSGRIVNIHGPEADRLRDELADIIRELLEWAAGERDGGEFVENGEAAA
ncbi:hypothetical protein [Nocardia sp. IFM 10818]